METFTGQGPWLPHSPTFTQRKSDAGDTEGPWLPNSPTFTQRKSDAGDAEGPRKSHRLFKNSQPEVPVCPYAIENKMSTFNNFLLPPVFSSSSVVE